MGNLSARNVSINVSSTQLCRVVLAIAFAAASTFALAQAGQLDSTFATGGIFSDGTIGGGFATTVALQSNGQIVVGGQVGTQNGDEGGVIRLNTNGALDTTFGTKGVVTIPFADVEGVVTGMAIQPDGRILVVGTGLPGFGSIVRLNTNGSIDTTFGTNGAVSLTITPGVLALQPNGEILVTGLLPGTTFSVTPLMQLYQSNGQLDTTFGTGGSAPLVGVVAPSAIALQPNGQIVISTSAFVTGAPGSVVRYNADGSLDTTFGILGEASTTEGTAAVALQANGSILLVGSTTSQLSLSGNSTGFGVARLSSKGRVDPSFGTHGGAITAFPDANTSGATSLVIQPNGEIVVGGAAGNTTDYGTKVTQSFALARYLSTGKLDTTFGTGGLVTTGAGFSIGALALQSDGKILAVGGTLFPNSNGPDGNLIVARYLGQ
ncbi:MAG: hypothetical protein ACLQFM_17560 [Terriglobales bacterium]